MIKQIKLKYISAIMVFVIAVIGSIITVINAINYFNVDDRTNIRLEFIIETQNLAPKDETTDEPTDDGDENTDENAEENAGENAEENEEDEENEGVIDQETPFDIRYFTVTFNSRKIITDADVNKISAVSHEDAVTLARAIFNSGSFEGYADNYKYRAIT